MSEETFSYFLVIFILVNLLKKLTIVPIPISKVTFPSDLRCMLSLICRSSENSSYPLGWIFIFFVRESSLKFFITIN